MNSCFTYRQEGHFADTACLKHSVEVGHLLCASSFFVLCRWL